MSAIQANDQTFQSEVLSSSEPVLVDFWAPWCGPCRAMSEVVEDLAKDVAGRAKVVKVNVDDAAETAANYGIQSIPAFAVFQDGRVTDQVVGVVPKRRLIDLLGPNFG